VSLSPPPTCVRVMTREEAHALQDWVVSDEWDEGDYDADVLFDIDPDGFWALLDDGGTVVGGLSIIASTDSIGSASHFYVVPEARGRGWARRAIPALLQVHGPRIHDGVTVTNFCWPHAVEASRRIGFMPLHDEIRMVRPPVSVIDVPESSRIVDARDLDFRDVVSFDAGRAGRGLPELCCLLCGDAGGSRGDATAGRGANVPRAGQHGGRGAGRRDVSGWWGRWQQSA